MIFEFYTVVFTIKLKKKHAQKTSKETGHNPKDR